MIHKPKKKNNKQYKKGDHPKEQEFLLQNFQEIFKIFFLELQNKPFLSVPTTTFTKKFQSYFPQYFTLYITENALCNETFLSVPKEHFHEKVSTPYFINTIILLLERSYEYILSSNIFDFHVCFSFN